MVLQKKCFGYSVEMPLDTPQGLEHFASDVAEMDQSKATCFLRNVIDTLNIQQVSERLDAGLRGVKNSALCQHSIATRRGRLSGADLLYGDLAGRYVCCG